MKLTTSDVTSLLQQFHQSGERLDSHTVDQLKVGHPHHHTTLASFRFQRQLYYLIIDVSAEDDTQYLLDTIRADKPDVSGEFMPSSEVKDAFTAYATPFKGKGAYLFKVDTGKRRLDLFLSEKYPDVSRSTWQKYIKAGFITVDDNVITSPKQEINTAAKVIIATPEAQDHSTHTLPIVFLDDNVIVVNKPIGVLTHSKGALNDEFTIADFFRRYTTFGLDTNRPGIVHRLDRDTSGVIIGARNPETASLLQKQFSERRVKKTYLAILDGRVKEKEAIIDLPIGRHPTAPSTFRVDSKGKSALTRYKVLEEQQGKCFVELMPLTGRTHQLRVHMQYLQAPIYGDRIYGSDADRLYLHAWQLEVTIPNSERKVFTAPIPPEFTKLFPNTL
jgi:23S rRNA pseudouridine1911/1915/1917 synthase